MKNAMFKHKASGGLYTVVAIVTLSLEPHKRLWDLDMVGVRQIDGGSFIGVALPNMGLHYTALLQSKVPVENGVVCVLYQGADSTYWLRPRAEFTDGRFEPQDMRAASMMPASYHLGF